MRPTSVALSLAALLCAYALPTCHVHTRHEAAHEAAGPHIHLHGHKHDHEHAHASLSDDPCEQEREAVSRGLVTDRWMSDHDADAVYVEPFLAPAIVQGVDVQCVGGQFVTACVPGALASISLPPPDAVALPPPRIGESRLPIYLRMLSLRI